MFPPINHFLAIFCPFLAILERIERSLREARGSPCWAPDELWMRSSQKKIWRASVAVIGGMNYGFGTTFVADAKLEIMATDNGGKKMQVGFICTQFWKNWARKSRLLRIWRAFNFYQNLTNWAGLQRSRVPSRPAGRDPGRDGFFQRDFWKNPSCGNCSKNFLNGFPNLKKIVTLLPKLFFRDNE